MEASQQIAASPENTDADSFFAVVSALVRFIEHTDLQIASEFENSMD